MRRRQTARSLTPSRTILPGELYCEAAPQLLGTILGSCVAVCLFDTRLHIGGMCHFILPNRPSNDEDSPRFGDTAVPALIRRIVSLGSEMRTLEAKLFGGASVLHSPSPEYAVGRRNVEIAIAELRRHRIPIVASHLSGTVGLLIRQCTACGDVWARPVGTGGRRSHRTPHPVQELPWFSDDLATGMLIRGNDGQPVAIRHRRGGGLSVHCPLCWDPGNSVSGARADAGVL